MTDIRLVVILPSPGNPVPGNPAKTAFTNMPRRLPPGLFVCVVKRTTIPSRRNQQMEVAPTVIAACLAGMLGLYVRELRRQVKVAKLHQRIVDAGTSVREPVTERAAKIPVTP